MRKNSDPEGDWYPLSLVRASSDNTIHWDDFQIQPPPPLPPSVPPTSNLAFECGYWLPGVGQRSHSALPANAAYNSLLSRIKALVQSSTELPTTGFLSFDPLIHHRGCHSH